MDREMFYLYQILMEFLLFGDLIYFGGGYFLLPVLFYEKIKKKYILKNEALFHRKDLLYVHC